MKHRSKPEKEKKIQCYFYSEKDMDAFESFVQNRIGDYPSVLHEMVSDGMHIDVLLVPPTDKRPYYTYVTMGMGAYPMPVPEPYGRINRAELAIRLPADWKTDLHDEAWGWPCLLLKRLARLPRYENSWLGLYHDIDYQEPLAKGLPFTAVMLEIFDEEIEPLTLENGDQVILYHVIPLYPSEVVFKTAHNAKELLERMPPEVVHGPLDLNRPPVV